MRTVAALALLLLAGCSVQPVDDWSAADSKRMKAVYAAIAADAITTQRIQYAPGYVEGGVIARRVLGAEPQTAETLAYMAALAFGYRALAKRLPLKWRRVVQYVGIADHAGHARENCDNQLC